MFKKYPVFLPKFSALDCDESAEIIVEHGKSRKSFGVTALAVHGLVECIRSKSLGQKINRIHMIVPDGQPVVWAMNSFHKTDLKNKIPGPALTLAVLEKANIARMQIYLYGSTTSTLAKFSRFINLEYPHITIAGLHADRFREATDEEDRSDIKKINESGAHIVLVGRGCPRQEHWVADHIGRVDAAMMAVGAAFDYHAGSLSRAPQWIQGAGLEWFYRLCQEPRRLWKRYLVTNSWFVWLYVKHKYFLRHA